jgi:LPS sulfotransferase NodH
LGVAIQRSYLICSSPRTGSNLLATAIRKTGVAGYPFEYFCQITLNAPFMLKTIGLPAEDAGPPHLASRMDRILARGTTPNGIFGGTVHWGHLSTLLDAIGEIQGKEISPRDGVLDGLRSVFPNLKFIRLYRRNHVAQGISHFIAKATKRWQVLEDSPPLHAPAPDEPQYDFPAIQKFVKLARNDEEGWRSLLSPCPENTFPVSYEELAADYRTVVGDVLDFIGMPGAHTVVPKPPFRRQANDRSAEWEARYRAEETVAAQRENAA